MDGRGPAGDLYKVLGVAHTATPEDIKKAYRSIALKTHPDHTGNDPAAAAVFREAHAAYQVLSNAAKRKRYDRGFDPVQSVGALFQERIGRQIMDLMLPSAPAAPKRGVDIRLEITVSSDIFRNGGTVTVRGFLLEIPPDVHKHPWVRLEGNGHPGRNGAASGALLIRIVEDKTVTKKKRGT